MHIYILWPIAAVFAVHCGAATIRRARGVASRISGVLATATLYAVALALAYAPLNVADWVLYTSLGLEFVAVVVLHRYTEEELSTEALGFSVIAASIGGVLGLFSNLAGFSLLSLFLTHVAISLVPFLVYLILGIITSLILKESEVEVIIAIPLCLLAGIVWLYYSPNVPWYAVLLVATLLAERINRLHTVTSLDFSDDSFTATIVISTIGLLASLIIKYHTPLTQGLAVVAPFGGWAVLGIASGLIAIFGFTSLRRPLRLANESTVISREIEREIGYRVSEAISLVERYRDRSSSSRNHSSDAEQPTHIAIRFLNALDNRLELGKSYELSISFGMQDKSAPFTGRLSSRVFDSDNSTTLYVRCEQAIVSPSFLVLPLDLGGVSTSFSFVPQSPGGIRFAVTLVAKGEPVLESECIAEVVKQG